MPDPDFEGKTVPASHPAHQNGETSAVQTQPSPPQPCLLPDFETLVSSPLPLVVASDPRAADRHLVARCIDGDGTAERALYDAHVERIYRLVHRMAGDGDLAADFTQETFIRAFQRLDQFRGDSSLATWLHTIAVSVALNGMRKVKRLRVRTDSMDSIAELPAKGSASRAGLTSDLRTRLRVRRPQTRRTAVVPRPRSLPALARLAARPRR